MAVVILTERIIIPIAIHIVVVIIIAVVVIVVVVVCIRINHTSHQDKHKSKIFEIHIQILTQIKKSF